LDFPERKGLGNATIDAEGGGNETMNAEDDKPGRPGPMLTEVNQRKARGRLGRDVQSKIGQQLRTMYDNVVNEGVPDRFAEMLRQLDEQKSAEESTSKPEKGVN
jgi:Anti-sigma factor NepR